MLNKWMVKMSFRNKENLDCIDLIDNANNTFKNRHDIFRGLYISNNNNAYYIIGTNKHFKDKIATNGYESLEKDVIYYYNKYTSRHNNLFMLEFYQKLIPGDVIIVNKKNKNIDEQFHRTIGGKRKIISTKCDQCGNNLMYYSVGKLSRGSRQCQITGCVMPNKLYHTHKLCTPCSFNEGKNLELLLLLGTTDEKELGLRTS